MGVVLHFAGRCAAHDSGRLGGSSLAALGRMQSDQLLPQLKAGLLRGSAMKITDGGLRDPTLGSDLCLDHTLVGQVCDQLLPVHVAASKHRDADIMDTGLPIVNIGKLMPMARGKERTPFGQRLFDRRKQLKLTQMAVAKAAGISQTTLTGLEWEAQGSTNTVALARVLKCSAEWLASGKGQPTANAPPPTPSPDFSDRHEVTEEEFNLLQDILTVLDPEEIAKIRARAKALMDRAKAQLEGAKAKASTVGGPPPRPTREQFSNADVTKAREKARR